MSTTYFLERTIDCILATLILHEYPGFLQITDKNLLFLILFLSGLVRLKLCHQLISIIT